MLTQPELNPELCSMKQLGILLLPPWMGGKKGTIYFKLLI